MKIRRTKLDGYTPTGALIKAFDDQDDEIVYIAKWADREETQLQALIFTIRPLMKVTIRHPEVMNIDLTYNTNCFGYPLYQVTGLTGANTIYNSIFGFIDRENQKAMD